MIQLRSRWLPALLLVAAALAASHAPEAFLLDRASLQAGQVWRLWTGHLVHHTAVHFAFDVGAAVALLFLVRSVWAWILLPPLVGLGALFARPELASYAGLSGVLHGLTVLMGMRLFVEGRGLERWIAGGLLAGVAAKAVYEAASGISVFSGGLDMGGTTVHAAHLAGVIGGALLGMSRAPGTAGLPSISTS